jgi:hypothetical protein
MAGSSRHYLAGVCDKKLSAQVDSVEMFIVDVYRRCR